MVLVVLHDEMRTKRIPTDRGVNIAAEHKQSELSGLVPPSAASPSIPPPRQLCAVRPCRGRWRGPRRDLAIQGALASLAGGKPNPGIEGRVARAVRVQGSDGRQAHDMCIWGGEEKAKISFSKS